MLEILELLTVKTLKFASEDGIKPCKLLECNNIRTNPVAEPKLDGIGHESWLSLRNKLVNLPAPNAGKGHERVFTDAPKSLTLRFAKHHGIDPVNKLLSRYNWSGTISVQ